MKKQQFIDMQELGISSIPNLLLTHYRQLGLNETELILLLKIKMHLEKGSYFPTPFELQSGMSISAEECTSCLRMFIQKGFLFIEECEDHNGIKFEKYSLQPLWAKLYDYMQHSQNETQERTSEREQKSLYTIFEEEFGRPLSPLECETLAIWQDQDQHDAILIKHALKEAVLSGKLSFRYIDRILFEWKKNGFKTVEQANAHSQKFRRVQTKQNEPQKEYTRQVPFYNWLEQ
ncbi:DnaD domain-containing protein [Bacillus siamensis]|uniref:DnaD domain protein n=1 Tax=Bacillus siamensis TaxID=659243 RepID=A0AAI8HN84_9BACI|nr:MULTISPECIES: DnaD domain-containing protein [Bacillus]AME08377.1 DNA replication protein DnaD [Bacillus sp. SDLI1]AUJ77251.1 DnaD domain protein [Bacillus siamensis]UUA85539.1 DnaD domain-containing protein [Bacillus siamensis]